MNRLVWLLCAAALACALLWPLAARGCYGTKYDTIHFQVDRPDYAMPPRPYVIETWQEVPNRASSALFRTRDYAWIDDDEHSAEVARKTYEAFHRGRELEKKSDYAEALDVYRWMLHRGFGSQSWLTEQVEFLRQVDSFPSVAVDRYLRGREELRQRNTLAAQDFLRQVYVDKAAGGVRAFAAYDLAGIAHDLSSRQAESAYERCAKEFPNSSRWEAAMVMRLRSCLQGKGDYTEIQSAVPPATLARAKGIGSELLRRRPRTRFRENVRSWLARVDFLEGRVAEAKSAYEALAAEARSTHAKCGYLESAAECAAALRDDAEAFCIYLRQLGTCEQSSAWTASALVNLNAIRNDLSAAEGKAVGAAIRRDTRLLQPYLDFRIYHTDVRPGEMGPLLALAEGALRLGRGVGVSSEIAARLAEMELKRNRLSAAKAWANRSLSHPANPKADLALYVRAGVQRKQGQTSGAIADYERLRQRYPTSYLCLAASENLAQLYEETGDLGRALDQYYTLGYERDVAYVIDIAMSIEQLRRYIAAHARSVNRELWLYSLGVRLLRANRLAEAEKVLGSLPDATLRELSGIASGDTSYWDEEQFHNPLNVVRELMPLQRAVDGARNRREKALATWKLGSYFYKRRPLLLYNYALWENERAFLFAIFWGYDQAPEKERRAVSRHMYLHECVNRARLLCEEAARLDPHGPIADQALYRAACATEKLANMNSWWRVEAESRGLHARASALMKRVVKEYPRSKLRSEAAKYAAVFAGSIP